MANAKTGLFQRLMSNPQIMAMANQMFDSMNKEGQDRFLGRPEFLSDDGATAPLNLGAALGTQGNGVEGINAGQLGSLALGAAKAHPFKTAGLVGSGLANIGGLTDNDKFGGQLAGLGLGGLGAHLLATQNPYAAAMMTLGGGTLGSLFDKLRARKEQEQAQAQAYYGGMQ